MSDSSITSSSESCEVISVNDSVSEEGYQVVGKSNNSFHNLEAMDLENRTRCPSSSESDEVISSNNRTGSANSSSSAPDEFFVNFDVAPEECHATCRWVADLLEEADNSIESNMKQGSSHSVRPCELEAECRLDALPWNLFGSNTGSRSYFSDWSSEFEFNAVEFEIYFNRLSSLEFVTDSTREIAVVGTNGLCWDSQMLVFKLYHAKYP